jgi:hypothetical protein
LTWKVNSNLRGGNGLNCKKLAFIDIDDEFNKQVSKEALKWYYNMEVAPTNERLKSKVDTDMVELDFQFRE